MAQFSKEEFQAALPVQMKKKVNQDLLDKVNTIMKDPDEAEIFRDNIIGMTWVLKEGKFKLDQYVNAVRYIQFTLMGKSNQEAYAMAFPDKLRRWNAEGKTAKEISSYVSIYNKGKLVNLVREAAQIPAYIYNQDVYQKAINKQMSIMNNPDASYKVQSDAANSLLTHLKPPETTKVELDVGVRDDSAVASLKEQVALLAAKQKTLIAGGGMTAQEVARQKLVIDGESKRVD